MQYHDSFNERLLKVMCLNQAIDKFQKETELLESAKESLLQVLQDQVRSEKLQNLVNSMRQDGQTSLRLH